MSLPPLERFLLHDNNAWTPTDEQVVMLRSCLLVLASSDPTTAAYLRAPQFNGKTSVLTALCAGLLIHSDTGRPYVVYVYNNGGRLASKFIDKTLERLHGNDCIRSVKSGVIQGVNGVIIHSESWHARAEGQWCTTADLVIVDDADRGLPLQFWQRYQGRLITMCTEGPITVDAFHQYHPNQPIPRGLIIRP